MKGIGRKLWSGMMLLVASVLVMLWLFQIVFLNQFYTGFRVNELVNEGEKLSQDLGGLSDLAELSTSPDQKERFDNLAYRQQLSLEVIDSIGKLLYRVDNSNSMAGHGMMRNASNEVYLTALSGEVAKVEATHPRFGGKYMMIGLPILSKGTVIGAVIMNVPMAPVEDTASILKKQLILITLSLLIIAVLISYYMSKSFTKPIIRLQQIAQRYAGGEFDSRVEIFSHDELGALAQSMNRMGEELSKNDQLRKELIANVSHELRTPLSLIRGYAETLRDVTGENPQKREKQLGVIIDETERLSGIVEDILSLSRYQAGEVNLEIRDFLLNVMLNDVLKRYQLSDIKRDITKELIGRQEILVMGDLGRLEQVLFNLLNNAVNHTKEGGHIILRTIEMEEAVRLEVIDDGEGIGADELPHVFERYYKGRKTKSNLQNGTGLGLAIVKSILMMHGIPFGVQSSLGAGTTFWLELKKSNEKVPIDIIP